MSVADEIHRRAKLAQIDENPRVREAARATQGLPVYADMGGILVLTEEAEVLHYDCERQSVQMASAAWRRLGLVRAGELHAQLKCLAPERPSEAIACPACQGSGYILGGALCGTCFATGWVGGGEPSRRAPRR